MVDSLINTFHNRKKTIIFGVFLACIFLGLDIYFIFGYINKTTETKLTYSTEQTPTATATPISTLPTASAAPTPIPVSYQVKGNQIIDSNGKTFIPYGVSLADSLTSNAWQTAYGFQYLNKAEIVAAHTFWNANTIVLPVASSPLFQKTPYNTVYLAYIDQVIAWAHAENMNTVLQLDYKHTSGQPTPNQDTLTFWSFMATHYMTTPWVFFDLFDEPYINPSLGTTSIAWQQWQNGIQSNPQVGMQQIVNTIRSAGNSNLIFAEGINHAETLAGIKSYLLTGGNIIYAVHPFFNSTGTNTPSTWDTNFGSIETTVPVVASSWSEYQASGSPECYSTAPATVPTFLSYLQSHSIGLLGYALEPGLLIRGWSYNVPTSFDQLNYSCQNIPSQNASPLAQGAGQDIQTFLQTNNTYTP